MNLTKRAKPGFTGFALLLTPWMKGRELVGDVHEFFGRDGVGSTKDDRK